MKTTSEVAEQLGTDRWQIARYCHQQKIGKRIGTQWILTDADINKIKKLRLAGSKVKRKARKVR